VANGSGRKERERGANGKREEKRGGRKGGPLGDYLYCDPLINGSVSICVCPGDFG